MTALFGATLTPLDPDLARSLAAWLVGENLVCPIQGFDPRWAVLQCDDTLVWCVRQRSGAWVRACDVTEDVLQPGLDTLQEARVFGDTEEALVWRAGGGFAGRRLADADQSPPGREPIQRERSFESVEGIDPKTLGSGFVEHVTGGGRVTVAPGHTLSTREYLADVDDTGILRIAATRFVEVK